HGNLRFRLALSPDATSSGLIGLPTRAPNDMVAAGAVRRLQGAWSLVLFGPASHPPPGDMIQPAGHAGLAAAMIHPFIDADAVTHRTTPFEAPAGGRASPPDRRLPGDPRAAWRHPRTGCIAGHRREGATGTAGRLPGLRLLRREVHPAGDDVRRLRT